MKHILLTWLGFIPLAILNGALRELTYKKWVGELTAHQISTFTAIALFFGYGLLVRRWLPLSTTSDAVRCAAIWVGGMLAFEFGFGHFISGQPWSKLLHDYNLAAGRIWLLLVVFMAALPFILRKI